MLYALELINAFKMQLPRLLAGISGASAVGMGAYGAHKFKPTDPHYRLETSLICY